VSNGVQQIFHTNLASIAKGLSPVNFSASHNYPREYDPEPYAGCQRALYVSTLDGPPEIWRYWPDCPACFSKLRSAKDRGGSVEEPALSPDNVYLAYTLELGAAHDLVITKLLDRLVNVQVTTTGDNGEAQWSPDGQWLVFVSSRDGHRQLYRMTLAGTSQTNISNSPAIDTDPVWQPAP
jgi:Tol biopolymer transport system component